MSTQGWLAVAVLIYLFVLLGLSLWSREKIRTEEDYLVAGRRLPTTLATFTLFATWFGAGTLMTATDEIRTEGLSVSVMEPYGAGLALIFAGLFFARPLWKMKLLTIGDFFRVRYGKRAEKVAVLAALPGFIGWIAVQLTALSEILRLFFQIPTATGILLSAFVSLIYTVMGGMWSVTLTDSMQLILVLVGLFELAYSVLTGVGGGVFSNGVTRILTENSSEILSFFPDTSFSGVLTIFGLFCVSALGNIPGQDLNQRIFASKSASIARRACIIAGVAYIVLGTIPVALALSARIVLPEGFDGPTLPALAHLYLGPAMTVLFVLSLLSIILSTITSAILAPASSLAHNVLSQWVSSQRGRIGLAKFSVVLITSLSVIVAFLGPRMFELLEASYTISFVALLSPLFAGLYLKRHAENSAILAMVTGFLVWSVEWFVETSFPMSLVAAAMSLCAYIFHAYVWLPRFKS